jgi:LacI family fructose operon transcriptional repressor
MIRQDSEAMITKGFAILDADRGPPITHLVRPTLVPPRTALTGPLDALKDIE